MKKCAFAIILLCLFRLLPAQILTIHSRDTHAPIERVTLMSASPEAFGMTDTRGQVDVTAFQGAAIITIRCLGYAPAVVSYRQLDSLGFTLEMVPSPGQMEEIVVSASRMEEENRHLPFRIARMTSRQATFHNPQTAADLLGASGEVFIQKSQQGGGSPMIRGFATNRLVYTVDGIRMNTAIFRAGNIQNVISLDPLSIRRTEVLFGPASVIYGSDAIGGVMCFLTLAP
ncbi:MAG: TonB-dependent receptor plug domain-containing protein, partial [Saprospiraceae bacterium]|nr:TonB-dependent receptor plug domain-containing protein [Saprospiraceae bacterium]